METNDKTTAMPTLTLDPFGAQAAAEQQTAAAEPVKTCEELMQENSNLSADELAAVDAFAKQIDITNSAQIMCYGADGQKKMADFSEGALENVRTKDLGQTGDMITDLIGELRGFDAAADEKGFLGFFRKKSAKVSALKAKYDKAEVNVERIAGELEKHQITLLKDVSMLDKMYEENLLYFKQLTMYILAGKKKLETERATTLPALVRKAEQSGLPEDAQKARDFADMCTRFEKKIYDLELTRNISIQMAPQIRLIQNNDTMMVEKIQTTIVNTIPLWKSQMVIALGLEHSRQAVEAQRAVTNMTNELLKKNAELLHSPPLLLPKRANAALWILKRSPKPTKSLLQPWMTCSVFSAKVTKSGLRRKLKWQKSNPICAKSSLMSPASAAVPQNKPAFQSIVLNCFITAESNSGKAER